MSTPKQNVGIFAIEMYFPKLYLEQTDLEIHDNCVGKYTKGLGLQQMGVATPFEDTASLALTATRRLMRKYKISPKQIGRIDCGTESIIDKSKSIKTVLMELFQAENPFIEGADNFNACFGGTAALFNSLAWCDSSFNTENKFALVVTSDLAKYDPNGAPGARATGGAGAVAILVGRNAPHIIIDPVRKGCYSQNAWDFYKPYMEKEFPVVDAPATLRCYFNAVDRCCEQLTQTLARASNESHQSLYGRGDHGTTLEDKDQDRASISKNYDYHIFHSPFYKIVEKSYARILRNEHVGNFRNGKIDENNNMGWTKEVEREWVNKSKESFLSKVHPGLKFSQRIGNMYTPSIYGSLIAFLAEGLPKEFLEKGSTFISSNTSTCETLKVKESNSSGYFDDSGRIQAADAMSIDQSQTFEDSHLDDLQSLPDDLDHNQSRRSSNLSSSNHDVGHACQSGHGLLARPSEEIETLNTNINSSSANATANDTNKFKRISMFSYGSGLISSIYTINLYSQPRYIYENKTLDIDSNYNNLFSLENLVKNCQELVSLLDSRTKITPKEFIEILETKTQRPGLYKSPLIEDRQKRLFEDCFYLDVVDDKFRRFYKSNDQ